MALSEEEHMAIRARQIEASEMHTNGKPSEVKDIKWLFASRLAGDDYPSETINSGKWLIFVSDAEVDKVWIEIKNATEKGRLGGRSKVSTAMPSSNAGNDNESVICVYTYDATDEADVLRIRQELRNMGFINKLRYKTDEATRRGRYVVRGHTKISKYSE